MNILATFLKNYSPEFLKKRMLKELFIITARAFNCAVPSLQGFSYPDCLKQYALFTRTEAEKSFQHSNDLRVIRIRLFDRAYQLGDKLRKRFHINGDNEVMAIGNLLYNMLGIEFQGTGQGVVTISKCFFSEYYTSQVCQLISALDEGVLAGLSGGGQLDFSQRITDGKDCCQAQFVSRGYSS